MTTGATAAGTSSTFFSAATGASSEVAGAARAGATGATGATGAATGATGVSTTGVSSFGASTGAAAGVSALGPSAAGVVAASVDGGATASAGLAVRQGALESHLHTKKKSPTLQRRHGMRLPSSFAGSSTATGVSSTTCSSFFGFLFLRFFQILLIKPLRPSIDPFAVIQTYRVSQIGCLESPKSFGVLGESLNSTEDGDYSRTPGILAKNKSKSLNRVGLE